MLERRTAHQLEYVGHGRLERVNDIPIPIQSDSIAGHSDRAEACGGELFTELIEKHIQIAIVVDEYGGTAGIVTMEEMRRYLRNGMGLCQGQTCGKLVKGIMARELRVRPTDIEPAVSRAPMRPIEMKVLARDGGDCK